MLNGGTTYTSLSVHTYVPRYLPINAAALSPLCWFRLPSDAERVFTDPIADQILPKAVQYVPPPVDLILRLRGGYTWSTAYVRTSMYVSDLSFKKSAFWYWLLNTNTNTNLSWNTWVQGVKDQTWSPHEKCLSLGFHQNQHRDTVHHLQCNSHSVGLVMPDVRNEETCNNSQDTEWNTGDPDPFQRFSICPSSAQFRCR